MRHFIGAILTFSVLASVAIAGNVDDSVQAQPTSFNGVTTQNQEEVLFKLKSTTTPEEANNLAVTYGFSLLKKIGEPPSVNTVPAVISTQSTRNKFSANNHRFEIYKAKLGSEQDVQTLLHALNGDPLVEWAEVNVTYKTYRTTPNDSKYYKIADEMSLTGVDQIWDLQQGSESVVVAVIDTGVDYTHPDLAKNIWINTNEIPNDGIDNDNNGFIDDVRGWDFVSVPASAVYDSEDPGPADNDPMDIQGHGTSVSGIVAAEGNNGIGIAGVSWHSKIMALRAGYKSREKGGELQSADVADALIYACDNGADIINMSFGGQEPSRTMAAAIEYCASQDVFLVAAAGNDGSNEPVYPAAYNLVVAVAASSGNTIASYSNYGLWVDLAAPNYFFSTQLGGEYGNFSGTSTASAFVTGLAVLVKSQTPYLSAPKIRELLMNMATLPLEGVSELGGGYARLKWPLDLSVLQPKVALVALFTHEDNLYEDLSFDPGEQIVMKPTVRNFGAVNESVQLQLTTDDPFIMIADGDISLGDIAPNQKKTNWDDAFKLSVLEGVPQDYKAKLKIHVLNSSGELIEHVHSIVVNKTFKSLNQGPVDVSSQLLIEHNDGRISQLFGGYKNGDTGYTLYHRIRDNSGRWSVPSPVLGATDRGALHFDAVLDSRDQLHVVITDDLDMLLVTRYAHYDGDWTSQDITSSLEFPIDDWYESWPFTIQPIRRAAIAMDSDSNVVITWVTVVDNIKEAIVNSIFELVYVNEGSVSPVHKFMVAQNAYVSDLNLVQNDNGYMSVFWRQQELLAGDRSVYPGTGPGKVMQAKWRKGNEDAIPSEIGDFSSIRSIDGINHNLHVVLEGVNGYEHQMFDGVSWGAIHRFNQNSGGELVANNSGGVDWLSRWGSDLFRSTFNNGTWSEPEVIYQLSDSGIKIESDIGFLLTRSDESLLSISAKDQSGTKSMKLYSSLSNELTLPSKLIPQDEGSETFTKDISAFVDLSSVSELGSFQYAIGTAPGHSDLLRWTQGSTQETTPTVLRNRQRSDLQSGQDYYISTRAVNGSGDVSAVTSSDGITYIADTPEVTMVSPENDATFTSSSVTFAWNSVPESDGYTIQVGSNKGVYDIASRVVAAEDTSIVVDGLPVDGRTVYVRITVFVDGESSSSEYTYTAFNNPAPQLAVGFRLNWFGTLTTLSWQGADTVDLYRNDVLFSSDTNQNPLTVRRLFNYARYNWKACLPGTALCSESMR